MNEGIRDAFGIPVGSNGVSTAENTFVNPIAPYPADNVQILFEQLIAAIPTLSGLASTAGAGTIGITAISGLTGTTVQAALASLESTKLESGASVVTALGYTPYPSTGGLLSGNIISTNGNGMFANDTGGTPRQIITLGLDNNVNLVNGIGGFWRLFNNTAASVIFQVDNLGNITSTGTLQLNNGGAVSSKDAGGTYRQLLYMAGDTVVQRVAGGATIAWFNQAGTTEIATLSNAGAFSAVSVTQTSDGRYKWKWKAAPKDLIERVAALKKVGTFTWKGKHKKLGKGLGASAQDWEEIFPEAVSTSDKGDKSMQYGPAAMVVVHALCQRILKLEAKFAALESRV